MDGETKDKAQKVWRFIAHYSDVEPPISRVRVVDSNGEAREFDAHYVTTKDGALSLSKALSGADPRSDNVDVQLVALFAPGRWVEVEHLAPLTPGSPQRAGQQTEWRE
jgi:hypothetical protein